MGTLNSGGKSFDISLPHSSAASPRHELSEVRAPVRVELAVGVEPEGIYAVN
jgi:hypothetical protein